MSEQAIRVSLSDIQRPVAAELDRVAAELRRIIAADFPIIADANDHLLRMKGKLFRPTLLLLSHQAAGGGDARVVTLAAVVELIHLATLVHDDSVDHSALRRGMPTLNALFSHQVAVIMGDYLYSRAIIELVRVGDLDPLRVFARVTNEMTIGEMRQLAVNDSLSFSEDDYYALIRSKTASLMSAACEVGSIAGASNHREALIRYGDALGMAFQIADDLIDYTEAQETTGKPTGLDLKEHKVTLPLIAALRVMTPAERSKVNALFSNANPSDSEVADVIRIVTANGGLEYAREKGAIFAQQAREALAGLPDTVARRALLESISYVMERHA